MPTIWIKNLKPNLNKLRKSVRFGTLKHLRKFVERFINLIVNFIKMLKSQQTIHLITFNSIITQ